MPRRISLIPILIALNVVVYLMWVLHYPSEAFMENNFLVSWSALEEGRVWTLITSVVSHNMLFHLLINMFVLRSFGTFIEQALGRSFFIRFYIIAGIISSLAHAIVSKVILHHADLPALGASGALAGLVLLFSLLFPKEKLLIFGLIPVPAIFGAFAFIGLDLWGLSAQVGGGGLPIGHGAHLGGSLAGILTYFFILRPRIRKMREQRAMQAQARHEAASLGIQTKND